MQYVEGMYLFYYPDSLQYSCFYIVDTNSNFENFENRKKKKKNHILQWCSILLLCVEDQIASKNHMSFMTEDTRRKKVN